MKISNVATRVIETKKVTFSNGVTAGYSLIDGKISQFAFKARKIHGDILRYVFADFDVTDTVCGTVVHDKRLKHISPKTEADLEDIDAKIDTLKMINMQFVFDTNGDVILNKLQMNDMMSYSDRSGARAKEFVEFLKNHKDLTLLSHDVDNDVYFDTDEDDDVVGNAAYELSATVQFHDPAVMLKMITSNCGKYVSIHSCIENLRNQFRDANESK